MKEFFQARKTLIAIAAVAIIVLIFLLMMSEAFGCFGCNVCSDSCGFWSCFDSCTDCMGCVFGC